MHAILRDYRTLGPDLWERFNAGRDDQLWYYGRLKELFKERAPGDMSAELSRLVRELRHAVSRREPAQHPLEREAER